MPIYPYECTDSKCGHRFEEIQKLSEDPIDECEQCGAKAKRVMGVSSFALKGQGWYRDGYTKGSDAKGVAKETREKLVRQTT